MADARTPSPNPPLPPTAPSPPAAGSGPSASDAYGSWLSGGVKILSWSILAALVLSMARNPFLGTSSIPRATAVAGVGILVAALALWLNARGRARRATQLLSFALPVLAVGLTVASGGGFSDPAILMLPATVVLSGVLLDRRNLVITTIITVVMAQVVLLAEALGVAGSTRAAGHLLGDALDTAAILGITGASVGIVTGRLRRTLERLRRQEAAMRASELRFRSLVDLAADAILVGTREDGITEANRRAVELTGHSREELLGRPLETLFPPPEIERAPLFQAATARGESLLEERLLLSSSGQQIPVETSSTQLPDGTLQCILRDARDRRRAEADRRSLEEQLRHAHKMEAVGRLAGGIAHEFNNLFTGLTASLTLALRHVPAESPARRWLDTVEKSAWRAAELTRQLLAFSRRQATTPRLLDLRALVAGMSAELSAKAGESVQLQLCLPDEPFRIEADPGQVEQIVLNLASNARDAMPEGGRLTVELRWAGAGETPAERAPSRDGQRVAVLSVADTGWGMTEEVRKRVFEPFFTTKLDGTGTGLGLAMVYGAIEGCGGWIDVESAPGKGSRFRVFLPEAGGTREHD